jgi:flagellar basal-body rod protein FlgF
VNSGIYTAYSGLQAQVDALDILANNLANLNTKGFKEERAFFALLNQSMDAPQGMSELNSTINNSLMTRSALNATEGSMSSTYRDLDIAIEGNGFLVVETPRGIRYTRNGSLNINAQGVLTVSDGSKVLGSNGRPITLGTGKVHINESGEIYLNDIRADRLKVVNFADFSVLEKEGSSLFVSQAGRESEVDSNAKIKAGYLEESNVNPVSSVVRMVSILRHFEAIQKSVNLIMNDINTKSIEKLGR